jgi:excisionase family DNA binding protein
METRRDLRSPEPAALLSVPAAAARLGVDRKTVWRLIREGELPVIEVRTRTLIDPADLRTFIAVNRRTRSRDENRPVKAVLEGEDDSGVRSPGS